MAVYQQFFYDGQIEKFIIQFIRIISGFQVEFGKDNQGVNTLLRVPVFYGDSSRQVAQIIANNSENTMPTVPSMAVYISGLTYDRDRVQEPTHVSKMHIRQRAYNEVTQEYENAQGNAFTIERLMPVPYTLELKVDIWCSNARQKLQLIEQLVLMFNPAFELQSTDNYVDWTSLTAVFLESPNWSSRSVPMNSSTEIDVATLTFKLPIWISAPAKIKKLGVIERIIANTFVDSNISGDSLYTSYNIAGARQFFTPLDYGVLLIGNTLTLLKVSELETPREPTLTSPTKIGTKDIWRSLVNIYGELRNGISQVRLMQPDGITEIVGTVSYHPTDESLLIFNADIDTYPTNTLQPINAIIDPTRVTVDNSILNPVTGTRYLLLNGIGSWDNPQGSGPAAWRGTNGQDLIANANDIIEYNGTNWIVSFDSQQSDSIQYVANLTTGTQYKWNLDQWVKSYEGEYKNGLWSLVL